MSHSTMRNEDIHLCGEHVLSFVIRGIRCNMTSAFIWCHKHISVMKYELFTHHLVYLYRDLISNTTCICIKRHHNPYNSIYIGLQRNLQRNVFTHIIKDEKCFILWEMSVCLNMSSSLQFMYVFISSTFCYKHEDILGIIMSK